MPPAPPRNPSSRELVGEVSQIRQSWDNDDGSATVLAVLRSGEIVYGQVDARGELQTGRHYRFLGRWADHARHGWRFQFDTLMPDAPSVADGEAVAAYLAKHCAGIGPTTAKRLVEAHPTDIVDLLIREDDQIIEAGLLRAEVLREAGATLREIAGDPRERAAHLQLFALLRGHGFYGKVTKAAMRRWKTRAPQIVERDPFVLLTGGFPGCGFLKCDKLYQHLGKPPGRLKRQMLAAWHALRIRDGDTWLSLQDAFSAIRAAIGGTEPREHRAVALAIRSRLLAARLGPDQRYYLAERDKAASERMVGAWVRDAIASPNSLADTTPQGLSDHQAEQVRAALAGRLGVLTGSPGTGKTYTAAAVVREAIRLLGASRVAVVAPTGKAAVRITEKMHDAGLAVQATTIHRLLKIKTTSHGMAFQHDQDNPLPFALVVVDEVSMVDTCLAASLCGACGSGTSVLLVGDQHQLPPVGHGAFLRDVIAAGVPTAQLTEIRRNAGAIVRACVAIKDGKAPTMSRDLSAWPGENLIHVPLTTKLPGGGGSGDGGSDGDNASAPERLDSLYEWLAKQASAAGGKWDLVQDVQVICARNATRKTLNRHLQARLNPHGQRAAVGSFRVNDKVICLKNGFFARLGRHGSAGEGGQEYVANGDIGYVQGFQGARMVVRLTSPERFVGVPLRASPEDAGEDDAGGGGSDGEERGAGGAAGGNWDLAYACTCHKFQGSECPVVIVLAEPAGKLSSREWLYTALSRARELCLLVGDAADIGRAVRNVTLPDRKTFLAEIIRGEVGL